MFLGSKTAAFPRIVALLLACGATVPAKETDDWRLELLAEEGVPTGTAELKKFQESYKTSPALLENAVGRLGAEHFATREQAEREILLMGKEVLPWLRDMPKSNEPEIRIRLAEIEKKLTAKGRWEKEDLLRQAVNSLLGERTKQDADPPAATFFVEFFREPAPELSDRYRRFHFKTDKGMKGLVSNGVLRMKGDRAGDGDQGLLLQAKDLTGKEEYPDSFRVEVKLGGEAGGEGSYHVGVSIGNVRALYHPGYQSGGFRFEKVGDHTQLSQNTSMGFNPSTTDLQRMSIELKRDKDGNVGMEVMVSGSGKTFREHKVFKKAVIGKLDHIGLERSGRTGGDAVFDDLVVDLGNH